MKTFVNGITRLNNFVGNAIAWLVLFMTAFLLIEVFFRYVLSQPTVWANELTQLIFGFYAVMSGGYILAQRGHVNVDIFYSSFSPRTKAIVDLCTSVLFFMFLSALLYYGSSMALDSISSFESSYSAWNPPIWPVKLSIPIGCFLLLLQGIAKLTQDAQHVFWPHMSQVETTTQDHTK